MLSLRLQQVYRKRTFFVMQIWTHELLTCKRFTCVIEHDIHDRVENKHQRVHGNQYGTFPQVNPLAHPKLEHTLDQSKPHVAQQRHNQRCLSPSFHERLGP